MNKELRIKNKISISVVILAHPGAERLEECIKSVEWCDEIIVVVDTTAKIQNLKIKIKNDNSKLKIISKELNNDFSAQRNFGLDKAKGEWVLFIDTDEEVSQDLASEIKNQIKRDLDSGSGDGMTRKIEFNGYYLKRNDYFLGRWLKNGETANVKLLRLAKKDSGLWKGRVHEVWDIHGKVGTLTNPILHYPHPTIKAFLKDINWYTDIVAQFWKEEGRVIHGWEIIIYPKFKFISNYFLKLGFLDGVPGFIMAMMMSFHSFLARGKLWLKK